MRDRTAFDAFYEETRARVLWQLLALGGDPAAAASAVRGSFVVAWHHWRRVSRLPDPESWVRRRAWSRLARHRATRRRHRAGAAASRTAGGAAATRTLGGAAKGAGPRVGGGAGDGENGAARAAGASGEVAETVHALATLPPRQRTLLVLDRTGSWSAAELAREVGVPERDVEQVLRAALTRFGARRGVPPSGVDSALRQVRVLADRTRWPRPAAIRRSGTARRHLLTTAGVTATVAALFGSGAVVTTPEGAHPVLAPARASPPEIVRTIDPPPARPSLEPGDLVTAGQAVRLAPRATWAAVTTEESVRGSGRAVPCQRQGSADPAAVTTLVRDFPTTTGRRDPAVAATQLSQLSASRRASRAAYQRTVRWFAGCTDPRVQLLSTRTVDGVGEAAVVMVLRSWAEPVTTLSVGVARTGRVTTTVVRLVGDAAAPDLDPLASLLGAAVNGLCGTPGAGRCAAPPSLTPVPPIEVGTAAGMLVEVDLPPVAGVDDPWIGTRPARAAVNVAATRCDQTDFEQSPVTRDLTRSFLVPGSDLPDQFGLTETVGVLPSGRRARAFVAGIRERMAGCEQSDLGTDVVRVVSWTTPTTELALWRVTTELSDTSEVRYRMGVVRSGAAVAQLGFVPAGGADLSDAAFLALLQRARQRLPALTAR